MYALIRQRESIFIDTQSKYFLAVTISPLTVIPAQVGIQFSNDPCDFAWVDSGRKFCLNLNIHIADVIAKDMLHALLIKHFAVETKDASIAP